MLEDSADLVFIHDGREHFEFSATVALSDVDTKHAREKLGPAKAWMAALVRRGVAVGGGACTGVVSRFESQMPADFSHLEKRLGENFRGVRQPSYFRIVSLQNDIQTYI